MKSCGVRFSGGTTVNVGVVSSTPFEKENSNTEACEPQPTYTRSPLREKVRPSQPSATGTRLVSRPVAVSSTLIVGGLYPPFKTSRYRPSGERAVDIGNVSSGVCLPAGSKRQPLLSRNPPPGSGPTCSRGAGWEQTIAAAVSSAARRKYDRIKDDHIVAGVRVGLGPRTLLPRPRLVPARHRLHRQRLLKLEAQHRLGRARYPLALHDAARGTAGSRARDRTNRRALAPASHGTDDRAQHCPTADGFRCAFAAISAGAVIVLGVQRINVAVRSEFGQLQLQIRVTGKTSGRGRIHHAPFHIRAGPDDLLAIQPDRRLQRSAKRIAHLVFRGIQRVDQPNGNHRTNGDGVLDGRRWRWQGCRHGGFGGTCWRWRRRFLHRTSGRRRLRRLRRFGGRLLFGWGFRFYWRMALPRAPWLRGCQSRGQSEIIDNLLDARRICGLPGGQRTRRVARYLTRQHHYAIEALHADLSVDGCVLLNLGLDALGQLAVVRFARATRHDSQASGQ